MRAVVGDLKGREMHKTLNGAIVALGLAAAALATTAPANAQDVGVGVHVGGVGVGVGFGDIAFGYRDGYWDSGHRWHHWRNDEEMRNYRRAEGNKYHDWRHDRDGDKGGRG
jgi:hypothetical protein